MAVRRDFSPLLRRTAAILLMAAAGWGAAAAGGLSTSHLASSSAVRLPSKSDGCISRHPIAGACATLDASCQQQAHAIALRTGDELNVITGSPFVVAGDMGGDELANWLNAAILPASRALAAEYFDRPPDRPITVMLLSSESAYRTCAQRLFGDERISRFGYYKPDRRAVLVNISEGPGPLLHELTHALMAFDFPAAPAWLAEGMAVLHESAIVSPEGNALHVHGLGGWRLRLLQEAARKDGLPPLAELFARESLSGKEEAAAYAQAGGFCRLLHEQGALGEIYRSFRDADRGNADLSRRAAAILMTTGETDLDVAFRQWLADQGRGDSGNDF